MLGRHRRLAIGRQSRRRTVDGRDVAAFFAECRRSLGTPLFVCGGVGLVERSGTSFGHLFLAVK